MEKEKTIFNRLASKIERIFGLGAKNIARKFGTAILTPFYFTINTGHFRSSLASKALTKSGLPLPWLTYPALDFLACRDFSSSVILEFGGGQSSIFWSSIAKEVITFETDPIWIKIIKENSNNRTNLKLLQSPEDKNNQVRFIDKTLKDLNYKFDVIIIDGMHRELMFENSIDYLKDEGIIICDDSESYPFYDSWQKFQNFMRIDFYGHQPGVIEPHSTSILFKKDCKFMKISEPIFIRSYNSGNMPSNLG